MSSQGNYPSFNRINLLRSFPYPQKPQDFHIQDKINKHTSKSSNKNKKILLVLCEKSAQFLIPSVSICASDIFLQPSENLTKFQKIFLSFQKLKTWPIPSKSQIFNQSKEWERKRKINPFLCLHFSSLIEVKTIYSTKKSLEWVDDEVMSRAMRRWNLLLVSNFIWVRFWVAFSPRRQLSK